MKLLALAAGALASLGAGAPAVAATPTVPHGYSIRTFATGAATGATNPDDVAVLGDRIFVAYQNKTGPDGTGGSSLIVAYRPNGSVVRDWSVPGRVDGLAGDPARHRIIATVNEDANSSLYTISRAGTLRHYTYSPDPASLNGGGTDAVSVLGDRILISASNPSPTTAGGSIFAGPAAYAAVIPVHGSAATMRPVFDDNAAARDAVTGAGVTLNLSDPDSNAVVTRSSPRFGGAFVLVSQGDSELIFAHLHRPRSLTKLSLTSRDGAPQVDDVRWSDGPTGALLVVDQKAGVVSVITGPFRAGTAFVSIPSGGPMAGVLGTINLSTGRVEAFGRGFVSPKGLLYLPAHFLTSAKHHKK